LRATTSQRKNPAAPPNAAIAIVAVEAVDVDVVTAEAIASASPEPNTPLQRLRSPPTHLKKLSPPRSPLKNSRQTVRRASAKALPEPMEAVAGVVVAAVVVAAARVTMPVSRPPHLHPRQKL
jgi:hypothetical protein